MSATPFQFNFDLASDHKQEQQEQQSSSEQQKSAPDPKQRRFQLVTNISQRVRERAQEQLQHDTIHLTTANGEELPLYQCLAGSSEEIQNDDGQTTDLVPGVYEGGLKVWECSLDLCRYLANNDWILPSGTVLELGCGHGLPACLVLREGLRRNKDVTVMFTDYNDFVITGVALSNIVLNARNIIQHDYETTLSKHVVLGFGDWMKMSERLCSGELQQQCKILPNDAKFDVILAAETTYTEQASQETAILLKRHLKPDSGVGLVACKRYYFGVGGGSDAFREAARTLSDQHHELSVETLQVYDSGVGNIRELLLVKCIPKR